MYTLDFLFQSLDRFSYVQIPFGYLRTVCAASVLAAVVYLRSLVRNWEAQL